MTEEIIIEDAFCPFDEDIVREIFNKMDKRLQRLKQENELKKIQNEELYADLAISNKKLTEYKMALEEIREMCKTMLQGVTSNCINNTPYLTALNSMENKINECIK